MNSFFTLPISDFLVRRAAFSIVLPVLFLLLGAPATHAQPPPPGENPCEFITLPTGKIVRWYGYANRTYFVQISDTNNPLGKWSWAPIIEAGNEALISYEVDGTASKSFFRLKPTDLPVPSGRTIDTADFDEDGISNIDEIKPPAPLLASYATDPLDADTDHDGIPDAYERAYGLDPNDDGSIDPLNGAYGDLDADGIVNLEEYWYGSNPTSSDSDADGLTDSEEAYSTFTDPIIADTDGDGMSDAQEDLDRDQLNNLAELRVHHTWPWTADTDGDTLRDGWELANGFDPLVYNSTTDPDDDGLTNAQEQLLGLAPMDSDTDNDGTLDGVEDSDGDTLTNQAEFKIHHTNPIKADTDSDGLSDAAEITTHLTIPTNHDTDGDALPDGWEVQYALNPKDATGPAGSTGDPDTDGLNNFQEWLNGCDPNDADSDNDGTGDLTEVTQGSNPNDPTDGGDPPPTNQLLDLPFTVSDPSESYSEKWKLTIKGLGPDDHRTISLASPGYGQQATATLKLRKWNRYETSISHLGTEPTYLEENDNKPDYDWEATVDGQPTSVAVEQTEDESGENNFIMVKDHWLLDNRQAVFTTEKHGDEEDIVSGKKAFLVPVAIKDNTDATGVDSVSITADPADIGYQAKSWIMAPAGGTVVVNGVSFPLTDDMHFNIPVEPATDLEITCPNATPNPLSPDTTSLSTADPPPIVTWAGTGSETIDNTPVFKIGIAKEAVDLPIRVKTMKKRTLKVTVFPVKKGASAAAIVLPTKTDMIKEINKVYGYQLNAWAAEPTYRPEQIFDYDPAVPGHPNGDSVLTSQSAEHTGLIASCVDADADFVVILIGGVAYVDGTNLITGFAPPGVKPLVLTTSKPRHYTIPIDLNNPAHLAELADLFPVWNSDVLDGMVHEMGHRIIGVGHPNQGGGPAPLEGTDRTRRLMTSGDQRGYNADLIVKSEWDTAESWMKINIDDPTQ